MSETEDIIPVADFLERGGISVNHLKRFWSKCMARRTGTRDIWGSEAKLDMALLDCLGLGLEPTIQYLYQVAPEFPEFEKWIRTQSPPENHFQEINRFNSLFDTEKSSQETDGQLSEEDQRFFDENGYLILRSAISMQDCEETVDLITSHLGIDLANPDTWYQDHSSRQGIMIQLFRHPVLDRNRHSSRIRGAYECLWKSRNLWVSTDRVGFNPPETETWKFPGPHLHLDIYPQIPLPFGLQGILYLTDTEVNQGAFTLVPRFHKEIDEWMRQFDPGEIPLAEAFGDLDKKPIAANTGDFIIWHHALPHGSSPNTHTKPRIVQYINWYAVR